MPGFVTPDFVTKLRVVDESEKSFEILVTRVRSVPYSAGKLVR